MSSSFPTTPWSQKRPRSSAFNHQTSCLARPFVKTKAITHRLIDRRAVRPEGWSAGFAGRVRDVVLPGYTVFSTRDADAAAVRLLAHGSIRLKEPLGAGRFGQTLVATFGELAAFLDRYPRDKLAGYGLVLEANLRDVATLSVGHVALGGMSIAYCGTQRRTTDNDGRSIYGGSDLICVVGGWEALDRLPLVADTRLAIAQARAYDDAVCEYPGFIASRRNYDVGQGLDAQGVRRSGVFEASWRSGGASTAELAALAAFAEDPTLQIVEVSAVKKFGDHLEPPPGAIIHFHGEDPEAGPMLRYTLITRRTFKKPSGLKRDREIAVSDQSSEERK